MIAFQDAMNVFEVHPESRIRVYVGGIKIHARAKRGELFEEVPRFSESAA